MENESAVQHPENRVLMGPKADKALVQLGSPKIRRRVRVARIADTVQRCTQQYLGLPVGHLLLGCWLRGLPGATAIERFGLPRHSLEDHLGAKALTLLVDPRALVRIVSFRPRKVEKRPSALAFIWNGQWDLRRFDVRLDTYQFISEIDENRDHLERTAFFREMMAHIEQGNPWSSHRQGILLDTPEKIKTYLRIYMGYLDDMAVKGYVADMTHDDLGVAISSEGRILKINRGLHRLAMAQRVGLSQIPVRVRAVHRTWWNQVTDGASGQLALERMCQALKDCVPEQAPGPMDPLPGVPSSLDFWPPRRAT